MSKYEPCVSWSGHHIHASGNDLHSTLCGGSAYATGGVVTIGDVSCKRCKRALAKESK